MGNSFEREEVNDLIVRRRSLRSDALYGAMRLLAPIRSQLGINSQLVQAIGNDQLDWRHVDKDVAVVQAQEARP